MSSQDSESFFEVWRGNSGLITPAPKLKILNQDTGKKVEKETLGTLFSPMKDSVIEEEEYEVTLQNAQFDDEGLKISASDPDGGSQTIQRAYHQVDAVDFYSGGTSKVGITLHIGGLIYRIIIATRQKEYSEVEQAVEKIRSRITDAQTTGEMKTEEDDLDNLKKLSDLKEEGIISEDEFREKKQEILDRV